MCKFYSYTLRTCVLNTQEGLLRKLMNERETFKALQYPHRDLPGHFPHGILPLVLKELIRKIVWLNNPGSRSRKCISINSPNPSTLQCWKTSFKTEVCSCSGSPSEYHNVEMDDSVVDLMSLQSIRRHRFPNFEMLDTKIASSLKKIIQNSYFRQRVNLAEQKAQLEDRFLHGRQNWVHDDLRILPGDRRSCGCS